MNTRAATAVGFISILLWSQLAVLTTLSGAVPPFQLVAMSFVLAGVIGFAYLLRIPNGFRSLIAAPPGVWALGVSGLFGYHFFYFLALRSAPALEANLINYLWPLLIVLFSAALPARGEDRGLKWWHTSGAALGLAGTVLIVTGNNEGGSLPGGNAIPWLGYGASILLFAPAMYMMYSVKHFFTFRRAFGIDHFDASYRAAPLVRQGIFRWTPNAMYVFGFCALWIPAFLFQSVAALVVATFSHAYIWVHYHATEKPDMRRIYEN